MKCPICERRICRCAAKPYTDDQLEQLELAAMYEEEPEDLDFYYYV